MDWIFRSISYICFFAFSLSCWADVPPQKLIVTTNTLPFSSFPPALLAFEGRFISGDYTDKVYKRYPIALEETNPSKGIANDSEGRKIYVVATERNQIYCLDIHESQIDSFSVLSPTGIAVFQDGEMGIVVQESLQQVAFVNFATRAITAEIHLEMEIGDFAIDANSGDVFFVSQTRNALAVIRGDTKNLEELATFAFNPRAIALDLARNRVYVSSDTDSISIFEVDSHSGTVVRIVAQAPIGPVRSASINALAMHPDGKRLFAAKFGWIGVLTLETGSFNQVSGNFGEITQIAFSSNGDFLYVKSHGVLMDSIGGDAPPGFIEAIKLETDERQTVTWGDIHSFVIVERAMRITGDFNFDDRVDFTDFLYFINAYGADTASEKWAPRFDLDANGVVDFNDFLIFSSHFGASLP